MTSVSGTSVDSAAPLTRAAWLGLGGNIGDVRGALSRALAEMNAHDEISVNQVSPIYKTPPWGVEEQPWFLNCCAEIRTTLIPEALLEVCQMLERQEQRQRTIRWGPRTIDIDIVVYEGIEQVEQRLTIPHPRATERAFVIVPLADIAPNLKIGGKSVEHWKSIVDKEGIEPVQAPGNWWQ